MKITNFDETYGIDLSGGGAVAATYIARTSTALGSNTPLVESGAGSPGSGPQAAAWDHVHPAAAGGTAASTVSDETTLGLIPVVGVGVAYARSDHTHGSPTVSAISSAGFVGELLVADTPAGTPLVFDDLIQNDDGTDLLYADL